MIHDLSVLTKISFLFALVFSVLLSCRENQKVDANEKSFGYYYDTASGSVKMAASLSEWPENSPGNTDYVHFVMHDGQPSTFCIKPVVDSFGKWKELNFSFIYPGTTRWNGTAMLPYQTATQGVWFSKVHMAEIGRETPEEPIYKVWFSNRPVDKEEVEGDMPIIIDPHGKKWKVSTSTFKFGNKQVSLALAPVQ